MDAAGVLPSGVVTFVLTDIVGSTRLWESAPEAMREALAVHDEALSAAVEGHGGVLLRSRGEDDSTFSVFGRASDAVRAAYDAQVALSQRAWPPEAPLRVRVAIHTGEATEQDGAYVGTVVERAARLRSVTEGGEIVVSSAVAHIVADHLPPDTALNALGQIRLRDLDRREEAFLLAGPGLTPTSARSRGELPVDVLQVKGVTRRERDVFDAIADRLTNAEIAARFSVSERTIETHVSALLRKLGAQNRIELATLAKQIAANATVDLPPLLVMSAQRSVCVGRRQQHSVLMDCWERATRGLAAMAVVTGEAGIGKSRLVAELAVEVHQRGGQVLLGTSTDGAQLPYQPFVEALSDTITSAPEGQLRADIGRYGDALARVLPGVPARLGTMPAPGAIDPLGEREATQSALGAMLAAMARRQPLLLVVEDMHWATPLTRETALHIALRGGTAPLLMVATVRDTPPELDSPLAGWLADVERLSVCDLVPLTGLTLDATTELLQSLGSAMDASSARDATDGNPLFLREIATAGPTSSTMTDLLADRFARLPDADLDIVDTAAVLGESFRVDVVADAAGRPVDEVLESLERAATAGLIEPIEGRLGAYAFVHALFRDVRYRGLSAGRLLRLHASVTAALAPFASDPAVLPDLARHACIAAPLGDPARAVELAEAAGLLCAAAGDHTQAAEHYQRALDVIDLAHDADERRRLQLTIRLGEALVSHRVGEVHLDRLHVVSDVGRAHGILRDAARLARRIGDAAAFADAVCSMAHEFGSLLPGRDDPTFIALAEEALALLGDRDTHWRARVLAVLGVHLALGSEPARGRALVREAVDIARRGGDPLDFVRAVLSLYYVIGNSELDEKLSTLHEALHICERLGHAGTTQMTADLLSTTYRAAGDLDSMRRYHQLAVECTPSRPLFVLLSEAVNTFLDGDLDLAEQRNARTDDAARRLDPARRLDLAFFYSGSLAMFIALWRGEPGLMDRPQRATWSSAIGAAIRAGTAFGHVLGGERPTAAEMLTAARADGFDTWATGLFRSVILTNWGEVAAAVGDTVAAQDLFDKLEPVAGQLADCTGIVRCSIDQVRAQLALALGDPHQAETIASTAVGASRQRGTPLFLARELLVLAAARVQLGSDMTDVESLVAEALSIADATGARFIRNDAARYGL